MKKPSPHIQELLIKKAIEKLGKKTSTEQVILWLSNSGVLSELHIIRFLIKSEYFKRLKATKNKKQKRLHIKYDLADEYDLSLPTINNIVYKYDMVKP
mgnify:CR=1 FL=1